ncbi:neutral zinc metallopeptidase [Actinophytocola sp.]|uniref:neutral zinc metallopeptidase n=1 Tax=Actinophytocola sp. TaxID=1872138 RepID=UPI002D64CC26|nr:neutral zinc metallopeptidase [Actinophytocola sp.]HYQ64205.1 neutral zinc metallopeptidase [Actinophytocola sp.]
MTQPPQGPWRPMGPLPPPRSRPLPPGPMPGYGGRPPAQPYGVPSGRPPGPQPGPPPMMPPPGHFPGGYPPRSTLPPWAQYPGHPHLLQPRRTSNTGALVATIIVVVLLGTVATVGFLAMNRGGSSVADTGYDTDPTSSSDPFPTATSTTTTTTETAETTDDTPTETTPAGPRPVHATGDNPLFSGDVGTPAVTCGLARWETNPAGAQAFFQSALPCLDSAWQPVLESQGLPFFSPKLAFPEGTSWESPCGAVSTGVVAAFYCSYDNTIYMPFAGLQTELYGARPGVYLALFAHEYGHHVQTLAGVMDAYWEQRYDAGADTDGGLELSRRSELQAQCFSGMFLAAVYGRGSVDDNILTEARTSQDRGDHNPGAPRDHGTDDHAIGWWEQGAQLNRTYQCNTWLSPPADVA